MKICGLRSWPGGKINRQDSRSAKREGRLSLSGLDCVSNKGEHAGPPLRERAPFPSATWERGEKFDAKKGPAARWPLTGNFN
jgi:hypothetical protein